MFQKIKVWILFVSMAKADGELGNIQSIPGVPISGPFNPSSTESNIHVTVNGYDLSTSFPAKDRTSVTEVSEIVQSSPVTPKIHNSVKAVESVGRLQITQTELEMSKASDLPTAISASTTDSSVLLKHKSPQKVLVTVNDTSNLLTSRYHSEIDAPVLPTAAIHVSPQTPVFETATLLYQMPTNFAQPILTPANPPKEAEKLEIKDSFSGLQTVSIKNTMKLTTLSTSSRKYNLTSPATEKTPISEKASLHADTTKSAFVTMSPAHLKEVTSVALKRKTTDNKLLLSTSSKEQDGRHKDAEILVIRAVSEEVTPPHQHDTGSTSKRPYAMLPKSSSSSLNNQEPGNISVAVAVSTAFGVVTVVVVVIAIWKRRNDKVAPSHSSVTKHTATSQSVQSVKDLQSVTLSVLDETQLYQRNGLQMDNEASMNGKLCDICSGMDGQTEALHYRL